MNDQEYLIVMSKLKFIGSVGENQYIFNLSTKNLSVGSWQLGIKLNDGTSYNVIIAIRS